MRLLLFDVDGTILRCGPQVRPILVDTMREVYGVAELRLDGYDFSGKTDQQIVLELVELAGLARDEAVEGLPRARDVYLAHLEARLDRGLMEVLPGVEELLGELTARAGVALGLLTGNWEAGARIKLSRFGLDRFFPFGAFGDDAIERPELLPVALERAHRATGRRFAPEEVLIVGDSCRDVACGQAHGVPVLAVTTGWTPAERLAEAGAHRVVASLAGLAAELAG